MITHDLELPIGYVPITGHGVDALENRKETGSPICLEGEINERLRSYLRSDLHKKNLVGLIELVNNSPRI